MAKHANQTAKKQRMTNERVVSILLQEISDVRFELKADIREVKNDVSTLKSDMSQLKNDVSTLKKDMKIVTDDLGGLRIQVHQNQLTVMNYMDKTDKRVLRIEAKAS